MSGFQSGKNRLSISLLFLPNKKESTVFLMITLQKLLRSFLKRIQLTTVIWETWQNYIEKLYYFKYYNFSQIFCFDELSLTWGHFRMIFYNSLMLQPLNDQNLVSSFSLQPSVQESSLLTNFQSQVQKKHLKLHTRSNRFAMGCVCTV